MTDNQRRNNIIALPLDFTAIDVETTGLDFAYDNIIEIAAVKYRGGEKKSEYATLIRPPKRAFYKMNGDDGWIEYYIPAFITDLTGITDEMVKDAPEIQDALPGFYDFIGDDILIGHNIPFDIAFLTNATLTADFREKPGNRFINTIRIAHKALAKMERYGLEDVAAACGVRQGTAHRALADCETTAQCFLKMREDILRRMDEESFINLFKKKRQSYKLFIAALNADDIDREDTPIYGKTIVFTGTLERMSRKEALTLVAKLGGVPSDSLTMKTNYLVIGNAEFAKSVKEGKTNKMRKAESYAGKGCDIRVISENTFFEMLDL